MPIMKIQSGITLNSARRSANKLNSLKSRIKLPENIRNSKSPLLKSFGNPIIDPESKTPPLGKTLVGAGGGAAAGALIGAVVGSVVPIVGTAIGAELGAWVGAAAGSTVGALQDKDFGED